MNDLCIEREVVIDAPADVVWRTITEPDQIVRWFADRVELEPKPGSDGRLIFENRAAGATVTAAISVEVVEPPTRFSFRWGHAESERPDETNSVLVEFTLVAESDERTRLRVTETGLHTVAWSEDEKVRYADDHNGGWARHCARLVALFE